ncbi:hypothetical protein K1Y24_05815 [Mammaliicoccus sciuri]|uniref:hypothetical protein n=1 Tax=Mammaliicoccus sciuri TaxID=1296 RepID=UPI001E31761A|nr:hypothetical protein [Mammaliicoccus sciuri]MCD8801476.1 hypothetical protein [Mammaliicoccus sciuri]MCJ0935693.1 hypothetical protein [Mammaliicoccus sciuri]
MKYFDFTFSFSVSMILYFIAVMIGFLESYISLLLFAIPTLLLKVSLFILGGYYRLDDNSEK